MLSHFLSSHIDVKNRAARWYIFIPKIRLEDKIWVYFMAIG
jgi:hypothetical protein